MPISERNRAVLLVSLVLAAQGRLSRNVEHRIARARADRRRGRRTEVRRRQRWLIGDSNVGAVVLRNPLTIDENPFSTGGNLGVAVCPRARADCLEGVK